MAPNLTTSEVNARLGKLPKWAQTEILSLRRTAENALYDLEELRADKYGDADTDTIADPYGSTPLKLRKGEVISFRLGYGSNDEVRVRVDEYGALDVSGQRTLAVFPRAANVVRVELAAG